MKKLGMMIVSVLCLVMMVGTLAVSAAGIPEVCVVCKTALVERGEHIGQWTENHRAGSGLYVGNTEITEWCTAYHSVDKCVLYCIPCGAIRWSQTEETVTHSSNYCK